MTPQRGATDRSWTPARHAVGLEDVGVALVLGVWSVVLVLAFPRPFGTLVDLHRPALLVVVAVATGITLLRRRHAVGSAFGIAALLVIAPGLWHGYAALYAVGAHAQRRAWLWVLVPVVITASFVGERGWVAFRFNDHAFLLFMATLCGLAGLYVGTRRDLVTAATERADRAEREQGLLADRARAQERARLAAEMHDVVTHRVNLMVLQAGALGVRSEDDEVRAAAEAVRASGVQALGELRDLVGVLHDGRDPSALEPADDHAPETVAALVAESRGVGLTVDLAEDGDPDVLTPTVRRTLHRVVREELTNARKHAPGAAVAVRVRYGSGLEASIVNGPATGSEPELAASGGGRGLEGLRRRVTMIGGACRAEVEDGGGFAVRVSLLAYVPTARTATDPGADPVVP
jgi:signal transduction histidine kinase